MQANRRYTKNFDEMVLGHEEEFSRNRYRGPNEGPRCIHVEEHSTLILSSVHGVNHYKDASLTYKPVDLYTAGITLSLAQQLKCSYIVNRRTDPAISPFQGQSEAEQKLQKMLYQDKNRIFLDIHGAKNPDSDVDLFVGTHVTPPSEHQLTIYKLLKNKCDQFGIVCQLNHPSYSAKADHTMTARALSYGCERSLQLELTRRSRTPHSDNERFHKMMNCLLHTLEDLNALL